MIDKEKEWKVVVGSSKDLFESISSAESEEDFGKDKSVDASDKKKDSIQPCVCKQTDGW